MFEDTAPALAEYERIKATALLAMLREDVALKTLDAPAADQLEGN